MNRDLEKDRLPISNSKFTLLEASLCYYPGAYFTSRLSF